MSDQKLYIPHSLDKGKCEKIAKVLNPLIADCIALYLKTKSYHWHLYGPHFRDYHLLFDEQAAQIFEMIDTLAERVRKLGSSTVTSIGYVHKNMTLSDDDQLAINEKEMLSRLVKDNLHLTNHMRKAHEVCDQNGDCATASILEVFLDEAERRIWFLSATLQG